jgi:hypothetical protein
MAFDEPGRSAENHLGKQLTELSERVGPQIDEARRRLRTLNSQATQVIKDHPTACLLGALGLGYLIARLARRESS